MYAHFGDPVARKYLDKMDKGQCESDWAYRKVRERVDFLKRLKDAGMNFDPSLVT
jgi:hypothetical protein